MVKYYQMASEKGNNKAMNNLGLYYEKQKDYDNMVKYYQMASEKGNNKAMNNLGLYYEKQKDYDNMMKYYLMAIENGNHSAMFNMSLYYKIKNDYPNMIKYYLMSGNDKKVIKNLYSYCKNKNKYDDMVDYIRVIFEKCNNKGIIREFANYTIKYEPDNMQLLAQFHEHLDKTNIKIFNNFMLKNPHLISSKEECCICLHDKCQLVFHCRHNVCVDCYRFLDKCPICRDVF
jgi:TPR repeat protein